MVEFNPTQYEDNPLKKYFRQAKVYITLPSQGKYWPAGTLDMPDNGELPVYAMTAKDELTMKTPDALLNGEATVSVIQSCVPNIKNAWKLPSVDLDAVLIAIRLATYGDKMDINTTVPNINVEKSYTLDLRQVLNSLVTNTFEDIFEINDMKVHLRPLTYEEFTEASMKTFEEQRIFALVNDDGIPDSEKIKKFNQSFMKLTELTVFTISKSISRIDVGDDSVTNPAHIQEFIENVDKSFYTELTEHLNAQKDKFSIKPLEIHSTDEEIAEGAPAKWSVPIVFDQSNFFA
jgi:hypothetical protein